MDCSPPGSSVHFRGAYMVSWPDLFCKLVLIWLFGGDEGNFRAILYFVAVAAKSLQSCPTLCNPIDGSPPGFAVPGILQARILEWVAISFSNGWKWKAKVNLLSRVRLFATLWTAAYQAPLSMGFSRQEYWSGVPRLNQTVFMYSCWLCPYLHVVNWVLYCMWVDLHIQWNIYCSLCFN